jgi:hypothetical protein
VTRYVDRGAEVAAGVGIGMALTIAASFLLVIPIEPIYWLLALPAGLLIGYYANQRSDRRDGPWSRIAANASVAGVATALTMAALLLVIKVLFFFGDTGYPDFNRIDPKSHQPVPPFCDNGAGCVYARYVANGSGPELTAAGITNADAFTGFYWRQQLSGAGTVLVLTLGGALVGGALYGAVRPKPAAPSRSMTADRQAGGGT